MDKLRFAPAGIPISTEPRNTLNGIAEAARLGLGGMELEFVQNVNVSDEMAPQVRETAQKNGIALTAHGSYYINLNPVEEEKLHASVKRIVHAGRILYACGGYSLTFHAGFYLGKGPGEAYKAIRKGMAMAIEGLEGHGAGDLWVRPETTGKPTQWGSLEEILALSQEFGNVMPCIDWAHMFARTGGRKNNTKEEFSAMLGQVEKALGRKGLDNMHMHISGINYTEKGERNHMPLLESEFNFKGALAALKEFGAKGVLVCESPLIEKDALLLKREYEKI
ncbi:MAG: TIM barrel protein [Candidatus Micrarchaeia archaeon]